MADTIHYAEKHSAQIDERFTAASITEAVTNRDYDFTGVKTIKVHSVPTVPMGDYRRSGSNRYGDPAELGDEEQEMTLGQDKAFSFTVDKGNSLDDAALNAGRALARQTEEVIVPMVDAYRLSVMTREAGCRAYGAVSKTNAYEAFLDLNAMLNDGKAPRAGRVAIVSSAFYKKLKLDSSFVKSSEIANAAMLNGQIGQVDGVAVVLDTGVLPKGVELMIAHPSATTAPHKLAEYKTHIDPPGISGVLVEGRDYYDAFVLNNKRGALGVHFSALIPLTVVNEKGETGKTRFTSVSGAEAGTLVYLLAASPTVPQLGADISDTSAYPELTLGTDITASSGSKYVVLLKDRDGKCVGSSGTAVAAEIGA